MLRTYASAPIPPCQNACPVKTRARDYIRAVGMGKLEEAYAIITENNPFPSVCGRVCMHPCEQSCRRNQVDEPISIAALKRYASDYVNGNALFIGSSSLIKSGKSVGIIGAGPSGLAAAVKLANEGHNVKVYEKNKKAGGMLRYGIPLYRLSDAALDEDIKRIEAKGVKILCAKDVGKKPTLDDLRAEHDAILVSVGLSQSRSLPIEGTDAKEVHLAIPFLKSAASGEKIDVGSKILIIGGGNVAIDVARTARRLSPMAQVTMACLESSAEMPASPWEVHEAEEENISIMNCMGPRKVEVKEGKAAGMHFITCASVFDGQGRFNPTFNEDEKHFVEADTIILSIGQMSDLSFLPDSFAQNGRLIFDNDILAVTEDGIFTCGEVAKGPGAAISAIANGNEAGRIINQYLAGQEIATQKEEPEVLGDIPAWIAGSRIVKKKRQKNEQIEPEERINNFEEFDKGLDRRHATKEALRCMDCGSGAQVEADKCIACLTCVRVCPFWVAKIDPTTNVAVMPAEGCQACGACAAECPAYAIDLDAFPLQEMKEEVKAAFKTKKVEAIGFICQTGKDLQYGDSHLIRVKCPIRIDEGTLLTAFEMGAKKVFITCHNDDSCRYIEGPKYIKRKVQYLKQALEAVGIGADNIEVFHKSEKEQIEDFLSSKEVKS